MYQLLARQLATAQMNYIIGSLAATNNIAQRSDFFPGVLPREPDGNIEMFPSYNILRTFGMRYLQIGRFMHNAGRLFSINVNRL